MRTEILLAVFSASITIAEQAIYFQCGGTDWTGGTDCAAGTTCQVQNPYYSQCLPGDSDDGDDECSTSTSEPEETSTTSTQGGAGPTSTSSGATQTPPPSTGGSSGAVNHGACTGYTGDKTGYATTTHYFDGQEGACGCGTGGTMASWQEGSNSVFTAAGSQNLFGGSGSWCGSGCGQCYELTNSGYLGAAGQGTCEGAGQTITVMVTNLCPAQGNEQWCSQPQNQYGFGAHFDILSKDGPQGWNNPVVSYKPVTCPGSLASDFATCQCASGKTSRARRGLMGANRFFSTY